MAGERRMISLREGDRAFSVRVAGVVVHEGKALIHRALSDDHWTLPGGRLEMMEQSAEALKREMLEELGVEVTVGRLLWLVEYYFNMDGGRWHEMGLLYEVTLPESSGLYEQASFGGIEADFEGTNPPLQLIFEWRPVNDLGDIVIYPPFLRTSLGSLPEHTEHVVIVE